MTARQRRAVLGRVPELSGRARSLQPFFDEVRVRAGERLADEGAACHQFIVLAEGTLETCAQGRRELMRSGESFGWTAMRERGSNPASLVATSDAVVLVMGHAQFRAAEPLPPKKSWFAWALPSSRRPLPHRTHLERA